MNDEANWSTVEKFFASKAWDDLLSEAIDDKNLDADQLMQDILLRFKSAIFRAEIGDINRFNTEVSDLCTITNYITNVYE